MRAIIATVLFFIGSHVGFSQTTLAHRMNQAQQAYTHLDTLGLMNSLSEIYRQDTILPDDAAFLLGYALYLNQEYRAAHRAFIRYVELTKESGQYFSAMVKAVNQCDLALAMYDYDNCQICKTLGPLDEIDTCYVCDGAGHLHATCTRCDGAGQEVCPTCLGSGFRLVQGSFYNSYMICPTCNQAGRITCENCKGSTTENSVCYRCSGLGVSPVPRTCTHREKEIKPNSKSKTSFYR